MFKSDFLSIKWPELLLHLLNGMHAKQSQIAPSYLLPHKYFVRLPLPINSPVPFYILWVERDAVRVKYLNQEQNTVIPTMLETRPF